MQTKLIQNKNEIYRLLKSLAYASKYDEVLALSDFKYNFRSCKMLMQQYDDGTTIMTYIFKLFGKSCRHRVVTYPNGLTYYAASKVLSARGSELFVVDEPVNTLFSYANNTYLQFYFIQFDTDVLLNSRVKQQVLSTIQDYILKYLTSLGLACDANVVTNNATITVFAPDKYTDQINNFLSSLDWHQILLPFKHLFSRLVVKVSNSDQKVFDWNLKIPNELQVVVNGNIIEIDFNDDNYFANICNSETNYDEIDGWSLFPQLKTIYTQLRFTSHPIQNFIIYGKVPEIVVHQKYLPVWRASTLKVFGLKIDDREYWFQQPIYVNRFFKPRHSQAVVWNTYLANHLNHDTFI
jgi:hypothetical protein